jgi:hypothetical protein
VMGLARLPPDKVSSDKWSLGWGWLAWLGLSAHTLYFRCLDSVELTTDHTYLDTIVTILLSHGWPDSYEPLTVYLQFDSYELDTAIAAFYSVQISSRNLSPVQR